MGDARARNCIQSGLSRGRNTTAQPNPVQSKRATSGINLPSAYSKANRDFSAMAAGGHGDHAPISVEMGGKHGSGIDD
jgi:hypothetical protein